MKINADFSDLWANAKRMGEHNVEFVSRTDDFIDFEIDRELSSTAGRDVRLEDLELENGVLSVQGRQVLLFIPDQGAGIDDVLSGRSEGRKFHVADCKTLDDMRQKQRFGRYKATYNISGKFDVYGVSYPQRLEREGEAELKVCKHCLRYLNYRGYASASGMLKVEIYQQFNIAEFLSTYSTLFKTMPGGRDFEEAGSYSEDWSLVSDRYRASVGFCCESCSVDLSDDRSLLHTHHISGNKRENHAANLRALCIDCHRKQPQHGYMRVTHEQMIRLTKLRKDQDLLKSAEGWEGVIKMADKALDGLLRSYAAKGLTVPEVGYELAGPAGDVVAELEVAWPDAKRGIAISETDLIAAKQLGWKVLTVGDALRSMNG